MLEIPESHVIAGQLNETIRGKTISFVEAGHTPHSFTWYSEKPELYDDLLSGKKIGCSRAVGGMVEIEAQDCRLLIQDGASPRFYEEGKAPSKHQLFVEFDDGTALACSVQMYGGIWAFHEGENNNPYYLTAFSFPS